MDKVRFGRALGYGARHAAKALMQAADAATTANPNPTRDERTVPSPVTLRGPAVPTKDRPTATRVDSPSSPKKSFFHPVKRYSGTVLLQVVGTFFAVFALWMAQSAWKLRDGLHQPWSSPDAQHFWLMAVLFCLFTWFTLSSFLRARRVERG